jgi:hypothetical protein
MVIRKNPAHDTENPPGTVTWPFPSSSRKSVHGGYPGDINPIYLKHVDEGKEHNDDEPKVVLMKDYFKEKPE